MDVAIKQLDAKHGTVKLMDFMEICVSRAASWEDNSLIKIFGAVLATGQVRKKKEREREKINERS